MYFAGAERQAHPEHAMATRGVVLATPLGCLGHHPARKQQHSACDEESIRVSQRLALCRYLTDGDRHVGLHAAGIMA